MSIQIYNVAGWIYVIEMALKIFSLGFGAYWMEGQNKFDFMLTWTICKLILLIYFETILVTVLCSCLFSSIATFHLAF